MKLRPSRRRRSGPLCLLVFIAMSNTEPAIDAQSVQNQSRTKPASTHESPEIATQLINLVRAYITAGNTNDPAARAKYFAPNVFYYGHSCTREQAMRQIASLYRRWPERKFDSTDSIELFEIPDHRDAYRVNALYKYTFNNFNEHLSGMSKLTFVIEHSHQGVRIIGVDEQLLNDSTNYQKQ
jgi:hypothetical protein